MIALKAERGWREMPERPLTVLFISRANAARSQMAEAILGRLSRGRATIVSAGVNPQNDVHPMAQTAVRNVLNARIENERPKSLDAIASERFDYVFTLCDLDIGNYPALAHHPNRIHWNLDDPSRAQGTRQQRQVAYVKVARELLKRLRPWWQTRENERRRELMRARPPRPRGGPRAYWRTYPKADAPLLLVIYYGTQQSRKSLWALFERSGVRVMCGAPTGILRIRSLSGRMPLLCASTVLERMKRSGLNFELSQACGTH